MKKTAILLLALALAATAFCQVAPPEAPKPPPDPKDAQIAQLTAQINEAVQQLTATRSQRDDLASKLLDANVQVQSLAAKAQAGAQAQEKLADLQVRYDMEKAKVDSLMTAAAKAGATQQSVTAGTSPRPADAPPSKDVAPAKPPGK